MSLTSAKEGSLRSSSAFVCNCFFNISLVLRLLMDVPGGNQDILLLEYIVVVVW